MASEVEPVSSYRLRRAGSESTAYAKAISWNFSLAPALLSSGTLSSERCDGKLVICIDIAVLLSHLAYLGGFSGLLFGMRI